MKIAHGHSPGDADEVPADSDKGFPHHHGGCHADHLAAPIKLISEMAGRDHRMVPTRFEGAARPHSTADPALRPPQA